VNDVHTLVFVQGSRTASHR